MYDSIFVPYICYHCGQYLRCDNHYRVIPQYLDRCGQDILKLWQSVSQKQLQLSLDFFSCSKELVIHNYQKKNLGLFYSIVVDILNLVVRCGQDHKNRIFFAITFLSELCDVCSNYFDKSYLKLISMYPEQARKENMLI